jgi:hypothetical protein
MAPLPKSTNQAREGSIWIVVDDQWDAAAVKLSVAL